MTSPFDRILNRQKATKRTKEIFRFVLVAILWKKSFGQEQNSEKKEQEFLIL